MFKKQLFSLLMAGALFFSFGQNAWASDFVSIGASVPIKVSSDGTDFDNVSGAMAYVKLPFLGGFGVENYEFGNETAGIKAGYGVSFADVFYQLPIPIVNITFGVGIGTFTGTGALSDYESGTATQVFGRLGIPFGLFDIHVSSHNASGKLTAPAGGTDIDGSFSTTAVGVSLGF